MKLRNVNYNYQTFLAYMAIPLVARPTDAFIRVAQSKVVASITTVSVNLWLVKGYDK